MNAFGHSLMSGPLGGVAELLWGVCCPGCGQPGWALCPGCQDVLVAAPRMCGARVGCPAAWALGVYAGELRELVLAAKRRGHRHLVGSLGTALGSGVLPPLLTRRGTVVLVPIPPRHPRGRGPAGDPVRALAQRAARTAGERGTTVRVIPLLRFRGSPRDQVGLGAVERHANLRHTMAVYPSAGHARRLDQLREPVRFVLVDDVVTTGATLREAARALRGAGFVPGGAAVVAERM